MLWACFAEIESLEFQSNSLYIQVTEHRLLLSAIVYERGLHSYFVMLQCNVSCFALL